MEPEHYIALQRTTLKLLKKRTPNTALTFDGHQPPATKANSPRQKLYYFW